MISKLLRIEGRVQGVGYRYWATREATKLGLVGWVRNRLDGSVEALVQGEESAIAAFVWAARQGPASADVSRIQSEVVEAGSFTAFRQLPTG